MTDLDSKEHILPPQCNSAAVAIYVPTVTKTGAACERSQLRHHGKDCSSAAAAFTVPLPCHSACMARMQGLARYATPRRRLCGNGSKTEPLSHLLVSLGRRLRCGGSGALGTLWSYVGGASFRPSLRSQEVPLKWSSTALLASARLILSARFCLHTTFNALIFLQAGC